MRTAFTVLLAAFMLTAPAAADTYFTLQSTLTASPGVIQPGDQTTFTLTLTLSPTPAYFAAGLDFLGSAFGGFATLYEYEDGALDGFTQYISLPSEGTFSFSSRQYQTAGTFATVISGNLDISIGCPMNDTSVCFGHSLTHSNAHFGAGIDVSVAPVPAPVLGAGLPGMILAGAGVLAWWRRRTVATR